MIKNNESNWFADWTTKKLKKEIRAFRGKRLDYLKYYGMSLELESRGIKG